MGTHTFQAQAWGQGLHVHTQRGVHNVIPSSKAVLETTQEPSSSTLNMTYRRQDPRLHSP
jgi:hypothetical protein